MPILPAKLALSLLARPTQFFGLGGARSDLWCEIIANTLERPLERVVDPLNAQLRGAALWSRVALGEIALTEAGSMVPIDRTFAPDPVERDVYDRHFQEYRKLAGTLRGFYRRMNDRS